jgi:hypothetical protein
MTDRKTDFDMTNATIHIHFILTDMMYVTSYVSYLKKKKRLNTFSVPVVYMKDKWLLRFQKVSHVILVVNQNTHLVLPSAFCKKN